MEEIATRSGKVHFRLEEFFRQIVGHIIMQQKQCSVLVCYGGCVTCNIFLQNMGAKENLHVSKFRAPPIALISVYPLTIILHE